MPSPRLSLLASLGLLGRPAPGDVPDLEPVRASARRTRATADRIRASLREAGTPATIPEAGP